MPPIYRFFNSMSLEVLRSFGIYICTLFKSGQCENMLKRKPFDNIHSIKFLLWFGFVLYFSFTFLLFQKQQNWFNMILLCSSIKSYQFGLKPYTPVTAYPFQTLQNQFFLNAVTHLCKLHHCFTSSFPPLFCIDIFCQCVKQINI